MLEPKKSNNLGRLAAHGTTAPGPRPDSPAAAGPTPKGAPREPAPPPPSARGRDIHGSVVHLRHPGGERPQQEPRLVTIPCPEIDDRAGRTVEWGQDIVGKPAQDLVLGPGQIVAGQTGDPLEELAAASVVEPPGRERTRAAGKPREDVPEKASEPADCSSPGTGWDPLRAASAVLRKTSARTGVGCWDLVIKVLGQENRSGESAQARGSASSRNARHVGAQKSRWQATCAARAQPRPGRAPIRPRSARAPLHSRRPAEARHESRGSAPSP